MNADISFIILMYSSKRGDSAYLSLLEQSTHGPLPLDVASAEQHKNRQACDESGQQPTDNTSRDHGKTKGAEKQEGGEVVKQSAFVSFSRNVINTSTSVNLSLRSGDLYCCVYSPFAVAAFKTWSNAPVNK